MKNLESTIIAQYANSPIILDIISNMNDCVDPTINFNNFYDQIWNIHTAQGFGLDLWGRILGVSRKIYLPKTIGKYFGFKEAVLAHWKPWGYGPFWDGIANYNIYLIPDAEFRLLLLAKALANISICSIQQINKILDILFGAYTTCYVLDNQNMTMTLVFETALTIIQLGILMQSDVIPRPAGVLSYVVSGLGNPPQLISSVQVLQ